MTDPSTEADLAELYRPEIKALSAQVRADRPLDAPDVTVTAVSPVCGSRLTLDIRFDQQTIAAIGWRCRACVLGMASLAIAREAAIGATEGQIAQVRAGIQDLLSGGAPDFPARWSQCSVFAAARGFPTRHGSILLPVDALLRGWQDRAEI
ncbi:iron-sulfur cluster assembly scaffold protein [Sedimentitalea nanhaiensis]|uniref:NifU homolog involved in Fe-S cluster formation n=1 Tax=Sedimentitalea nanhaiensis TaxID=999627 RepID=A0A1I7D5T3_9RHOB|nr:iron-sulfur cluster assembly scaffold protein [Sedimentitalea nanhaiensis]SFU06997.1 NifU homolog involved in Fe-S cluster formation [Sedimentitalea nanhaiensis]